MSLSVVKVSRVASLVEEFVSSHGISSLLAPADLEVVLCVRERKMKMKDLRDFDAFIFFGVFCVSSSTLF